jgi:ribulose-5-phosphate 4-epimerase/fuculose-1-phosphate aldolase
MMGKGSMRLGELRAEVARYAKKMVASGLVRAAQGNLSVRDPETGLICITPSGMDYDLVTAEDIVVIDEQGEVVEGAHRPSVETPLHTLLLRRRSDIHCVMHTHSLYATAFGVVYEPLPMVLAESALCLGGTIPIAPYQMSGTPEFAELIAETMGDANAIMWWGHHLARPSLPPMRSKMARRSTRWPASLARPFPCRPMRSRSSMHSGANTMRDHEPYIKSKAKRRYDARGTLQDRFWWAGNAEYNGAAPQRGVASR